MPLINWGPWVVDKRMKDAADAGSFTAYAVGICCASVCTTLSDDEATARLNLERPTGVGPWHISSDPAFSTGEPNPHPCERGLGRHLLYNC